MFVLECANQPTNGTTASCIRFAKELEKKGHEVSIIGCNRIVGERYHRHFGLQKYKFPVTDSLIVKGGFLVCRLIYETLYEAITCGAVPLISDSPVCTTKQKKRPKRYK